MSVAFVIVKEEEKCDPKKLEEVIDLLGENKPYKEIMLQTGISLFDLSTYLEVAYYKTNYDPVSYVAKEKITAIMNEFEKKSFPTLKAVKTALPNCDYTEIRTVRGVYFRKTRYYQKKKTAALEVKAEVMLDNKLDLKTVPYLMEAINTLKTDRWKIFAKELFAKYAPKQFYILPASLSGKHHNETEYAKGYFDQNDPMALSKFGGKYYHSIRVLRQLEEIIETDHPEIWDYNHEKVTKYVYGNEFEDWEMDAMKVAALSHDIYSGGVEDELNPKKRSMDKKHAHYHKTLLKPLGEALPEKEWNAYVMMVDSHMWKWDDEKPSISFKEGLEKTTPADVYEHFNLYRMVKWVELSDYIASRKTDDLIPRLRQAFITWFYLKKDLLISFSDLKSMGINKEDVVKTFGDTQLSEIAKIVVGPENLKDLLTEDVEQLTII